MQNSTVHLNKEHGNEFGSSRIIVEVSVMTDISVLNKCRSQRDSMVHYIFMFHGNPPLGWLFGDSHRNKGLGSHLFNGGFTQ